MLAPEMRMSLFCIAASFSAGSYVCLRQTYSTLFYTSVLDIG
jgi:hypothetical protein